MRVRPLNKSEKASKDGANIVLDVPAIPRRDEIVIKKTINKGDQISKTQMNFADRKFTFDRVFDNDTTQSLLFNSSVAPVIDQVVSGYSCTVFAYGQTGKLLILLKNKL